MTMARAAVSETKEILMNRIYMRYSKCTDNEGEGEVARYDVKRLK